ncbi:fimbrial protein [Achromobacter xylosoxidans]|uniref:fimbrial protein n=1 Tax=Alcaligenes xylosoxydans xylosoxydans TaxID=85698 RepID=UPI00211ACAB6|nr:fimbrial protein [Achromobacter xylosoxidans]
MPAGSRVGEPNIYSIGVPGVGVRLTTLYKNCPQEYWQTTCLSIYSPSQPDLYKIRYELVKYGPIRPGGGVLPAGQTVGSFSYGGWGYVNFFYAGTTSVILKRQPTCSFSSNGAVQVSLATVSAGSFKGVGSTSSERPFKIDLSCKGGDGVTPMDAYVTLTDATDPGNRSKVLTLSPESGAKGVGVEVLSGTTVLGYGADSSALGNPGQWKAGTVSPGTSVFSIPLAARYVQTESAVTPGTGNARATFTMSYQ